MRYDFHFHIEKPLSNSLNYPCPKFLLQPLVENALIHGYQPGMEIRVRIWTDDAIHLTVSDSGTGMDSETLAGVRRLSPSRSSGFGIGLSYVISSLQDFFSGRFDFHIESCEDQGTVVAIDFPKLKGNGYHVENTDC